MFAAAHAPIQAPAFTFNASPATEAAPAKNLRVRSASRQVKTAAFDSAGALRTSSRRVPAAAGAVPTAHVKVKHGDSAKRAKRGDAAPLPTAAAKRSTATAAAVAGGKRTVRSARAGEMLLWLHAEHFLISGTYMCVWWHLSCWAYYCM